MALSALLISFLFCSLCFYTPATTAQICRSSCPGDVPPIRFPFGLTDTSNNRCRYPGFTISCDIQNRAILTLPNSAQFAVQDIDYKNQRITLNDPNSCIARRLLNGSLNLSGSPFRAVNDTRRLLDGSFNLSGSPFRAVNDNDDLWFFNCSPSVPFWLGSDIKTIPCLGRGNYTIVVVAQRKPYNDHHLCSFMKRVTVPALSWLSSDPAEGLVLEWLTPNCSRCERRGRTCGFKNNQSLDIGCSGAPSKGHRIPRSAKYGIIIGVAIPGLLCLIGLSCYICGKLNNYTHRRRYPTAEFSTSTPLQAAVVGAGLDGPTIELFHKTLLGESRRLPNPSDNTCSICLSEYQPKEALRTIPECKHYFHADCIDEWLRMNKTCPLCRNSSGESMSVTPFTSLSSSSSLSSVV